jgi:phospholipid transport system substrate-binding protein
MSPTQSLTRVVTLAVLALAVAGAGHAQSMAAVESAPPVAATQPSAKTPTAVVATLQDALLNIMQNADSLGFQGRYEYLEPVVGETFDVAFMGSKSVGRHWKKLGPEEQSAWLAMFTGYLCANYAGNFKGWDGEAFEVLGEQPAARDTRVVLTKLVVPGGEDVDFNYRLRADEAGRWRIIDIYLKGTVSELALRRSDFSTTLKDKGFDELTVALDQKIADLRKKGGG